MSGISQADLIYEVVAEGGITRVVGLYKNPALVPVFGSIRSTRAYYLDIAQGHDAILMHVGGSQEALDLIKSRKLFTLDGRYYEGTMCYRDKARIKTAGLEHSMFAKGTSVEETIATSKSRTTYTADFKSDALRFVAKATPEGGNATKVSVKHSNYKTGIFEYDETDGLYYVSQYGSKMVDGQTGDQVNAKNVLILYTSISQIPGDKAGRMRATMTGTGNGTYICDGKQEAIQWSKKTVADPFVYTQADGKPLQLATGVSYINIVDKSAKVTIE